MAAVIALVVVIAVTSGSGDGGPADTASPGTSAGASADETAIRQMIYSLAEFDAHDSSAVLQEYFCAGDRELLKSLGDLDGVFDVPGDTSTPIPVFPEITDIKVNGDKATGRISVTGLSTTQHFRKEGGKWTFCMTDSPEYADLPTFPR